MGSFAADHLIARRARRYVAAVRPAVAGAEQGLLMTVGITPDPARDRVRLPAVRRRRSATARCGAVEEFKEKPAHDVAVAYLRVRPTTCGTPACSSGGSTCSWPSWPASSPSCTPGCAASPPPGTPRAARSVLGEVWPTLPKISVDYAVMEGAAAAGLVGTVPGDFGWNDVGDFHTLGDVLAGRRRPATSWSGADAEEKPGVLLHDSPGLVVVPQSGRLVAALGVRDLVIVDTPDAVLVCPRDRAQDVKQLVDELKERGETDGYRLMRDRAAPWRRSGRC